MQRQKEKRKRNGFAKMITQFIYRQAHQYETSNRTKRSKEIESLDKSMSKKELLFQTYGQKKWLG